MRLVCIAVGASALTQLERYTADPSADSPSSEYEILLHYVGGDHFGPKDWAPIFRDLEGSDMVLLDLMGVSKDFGETLFTRLIGFSGDIVVINTSLKKMRGLTRLGSFTMKSMSGNMGGKTGKKEKRNKKEKGAVSAMDKMRRMIDSMEKIGKALPVGPLRDVRNFIWIGKYWRFPTEKNIQSLINCIGRDYFKISSLPKPEAPEIVQVGVIQHPKEEKSYTDYLSYAEEHRFTPEKPMALLLYSQSQYPVNTHPAVADLLLRFEAAGVNVVPVPLARLNGEELRFIQSISFPGEVGGKTKESKERDGGKDRGKDKRRSRFHVCCNCIAFRLGQGPMGGSAEEAVDFLTRLDVPVLHPFFISKRSQEEWLKDKQGVRSGEFMLHYFLPELDGGIESYPIGASGSERITGGKAASEALVPPGDIALIDERVEKLISRIKGWARLKTKKNSEKKVAFLLYNYPPGEGNLGGGAFLDTFSSMEAVLDRLAEEGYRARRCGGEELRKRMLALGVVNSPRWQGEELPGSSGPRQQLRGTEEDAEEGARGGRVVLSRREYKELTRGQPDPEGVERQWGPFPGKIMTTPEGVKLPVLEYGNILIILQPPRSERTEDIAQYHDPYIPPHQQYIGLYKWLEAEAKVDALVHVGTHGTLEFLPGKERAMSGSCYPDYLVGSLPHIYLYYSGNPSESMIAKRRSHAVMLSHMEPVFGEAGLSGEIKELNALVSELSMAENTDAERGGEIEGEMRTLVESLGWKWEGVKNLEKRLYEYGTSLIPKGPHILGRSWTKEEALPLIYEILKRGPLLTTNRSNEGPGDENVEGKDRSLTGQIADGLGCPYEEMLERPDEFREEWDRIKRLGEAWIRAELETPKEDGENDRSGFSEMPELGPSEEALKFRVRELYRSVAENRELEALCKALDGSYVPAGPAGDVTRDPEILPTGRNMYQFDPRRVPSPSAEKLGRKIAKNTLEQYKSANGSYPKKVALVFWGLETAKTHGESVAQVFEYLGVRVRTINDFWEYRLEAVPLAELGHPRIDVTLQMSGFFRDLFPHCMEMLNEAFHLVASLEEGREENYFKAASEELFRELIELGTEAEEARDLSRGRLFGPAQAVYGTGLTGIVNSSVWKEEEDLSESFMNSMRYIYTKGRYGEEHRDLLEANLRRGEKGSQVRSSRDYEMTDLDHFYEFFGGLSRSVESRGGKKPAMLVSDTYQGRVRTEKIEEAVRRGAWTRLLNPVWIEGVLKDPYGGSGEIADRLENLLGLSATTGAVDNEIYTAACDKILLNEDIRHRIRESNPYALLEMIERLFETQSRGYWDVDDERLEKLKELYMELEGEIEGT